MSAAIDASNPWLGLNSFTEETRAYFYGREEEVGELTRRIQRKLLTVLFGQSGLGKTSILRAGIVPGLRAQGYCPVYVRVDYGPAAPSAAQQIKQAILQATEQLGTWTRAGVAAHDESLWEFLHHRDDVLTGADGEPMMPLLIFDQFEEIFTLAQTDDDGRERAAAFVEALAELVENRPSRELEARLDEDDDAVAQFDFARCDYRILIALREDYLAHLESLKGPMPSITQNRMRLAPMTGHQALAAVTGPGAKLVTTDVAEAIVRFVAGGAELANAQVEPSLLSLICRELNDRRLQSGRSEISLDLLAGSHASILTDFYERTLADQPEAVRRVVEDVLLTDSGYRENVAEERVTKALAAAGAAPGTLATLVNRRLLRIEDRLDVRRVELTHDVLCGVVGDSRQQREERDKHAAVEREIVAQQGREAAARKSLVKTRRIMAACVVLTCAAVGSTAFGLLKMKEAQQTRKLADQSRTEAEKLLSYLMVDFYTELEQVGQIALLREFTERTVKYDRALPATMRTPATEANRAMALIQLANVGRNAGGTKEEAAKLLDEAISIMDEQVAKGNLTEDSQLVLSRALRVRGFLAASNADPVLAVQLQERAIRIAKPFFDKPNPTVAARLAYSQAMRTNAHFKNRNIGAAAGIAELKGAVAAADIGAGLADNMPLATAYIDAAVFLHESYIRTDRVGDADTIAAAVERLTREALAKHPGSFRLLNLRIGIPIERANYAINSGDPSNALTQVTQGLRHIEDLLIKDPGNRKWLDDQSILFGLASIAHARLGDQTEAGRHLALAFGPYDKFEPSASQKNNLHGFARRTAAMYAELENDDELKVLQARMRTLFDARTEKLLPEVNKLYGDIVEAQLQWTSGQLDSADQVAASLQKHQERLGSAVAALDPGASKAIFIMLTQALDLLQGQIAQNNGDSELAARSFAAVLANVNNIGPQELKLGQVQLAQALLRLGRGEEAREPLQRTIKALRAAIAAGRNDYLNHLKLAEGLYVQAQMEPQHSAGLLKEAADLLARLPENVQRFRSVRTWRARIADGRRAPERLAETSRHYGKN